MVEIISKSDGPRREDAAAKQFIRENAGTIARIAQQLGAGQQRSMPNSSTLAESQTARRRPAEPRREEEKRPYVKVSLNGRVIAVDFNNGRQLHYFGEIRGQGQMRRFLLATSENKFFAPLDDDLHTLLRELDGAAMPDEMAEAKLIEEIGARLGYST
jgi:hypothetical protein